MGLLILIVLALLCASIAGIGLLVSARRERVGALRKRLARADALIDTLQSEAAEHVALGDNFARIVLDEIRQHDATNRKELA